MTNDDRKWSRRGLALLLSVSVFSGIVGYSIHPDTPQQPTPTATQSTGSGSSHVEKHDPHTDLDELLAKEKLLPSLESVQPNNCRIVDPPDDPRDALVGPFRYEPTTALVFVQDGNSQKQAPRVVSCASPSATWGIEREFAPQYWLAKKR